MSFKAEPSGTEAAGIPSVRSWRHAHGYFLLLMTVVLVSYGPVFLWMWDRWFARDSYYSHGILVPFVTAFLVWQKRDELKSLPIQASPWGPVLVAAGLLVYVVSGLLRVYFTAGFSFLIVFYGIVLHCYGWRIMRAVFCPLLFLVFMIPLPLIVVVNASFRLKILAAEMAERVLNAMGLMAVRQGSIIRMQNAYVIVDDVCSGLRSIISLTALGSVFAYLLPAPRWKKVVLFVLTLPIAIVTNMSRVVFLSAVSEIWGPTIASGWLHDFSGYTMFFMAFLMLWACSKLLEG